MTLVCQSQHFGIFNSRRHFPDAKHFIPIISQPVDDRLVDILVRD
jgi:hypothetical protein